MLKILTPFILLSVLIFGLSSCSMIGVGYDFGDWLLKKRILKFVKFYSPQQEKLEIVLDDFMSWHKKNALEIYKQDVLRVKKRFEVISSKPIDAKELAIYLGEFRSRYFESFNYLSSKMVPILVLLNGDQVERTKVLLGRKLDEKKERTQILKTELVKQLERKWIENLEEWFGKLSENQLEMIREKSGSTFVDPVIVWSRHGKRTNEFINIFDENESNKRESALLRFFQDWEKDDFYASWRMDVSEVLADFIKLIDERQRVHILKKLDETLEIIKNLQD